MLKIRQEEEEVVDKSEGTCSRRTWRTVESMSASARASKIVEEKEDKHGKKGGKKKRTQEK
jgi:hypothetical protein